MNAFGFPVIALAALLLVGAGCADTEASVAIPAGNANGETAISARPLDLYEATEKAKKSPMPSNETATPSSPAPDPTAPEQKKYERPTKFPGILPAVEISGKIARISTPKGEIVFDVLDGEAPKAASNFIALARSGFYDGLTFHRVEPGFVIQGGDPDGDGTGGPGYTFEEEPVRLDYEAGIVAMAKRPTPHTSGSQFFIMLEDTPLPKEYTIFGRVRSGMDAVRAIRMGDRMTAVTIEPAP